MNEDKEPRRWVRAFPRDWRDRYAREFGALVDDLREEGDLRPSDRIDIIRSGLAMRRLQAKRRSVYKTLGPVFAAASVLVGLALAGTFGPSPKFHTKWDTLGPHVSGQVIVLHADSVSVPPATGPITFCQVTPSTGAVPRCEELPPHREHSKLKGVTVTIPALKSRSES
jgi:hypothetical protein